MRMENEFNELKTRVALLERLVLTLTSQIDNNHPSIQNKSKTKERTYLINNIRRRVL